MEESNGSHGVQYPVKKSVEERKLRVIVLTQDERSILPEAIDYLLRRLDPDVEVVGAVIFSASTFGKSDRW